MYVDSHPLATEETELYLHPKRQTSIDISLYEDTEKRDRKRHIHIRVDKPQTKNIYNDEWRQKICYEDTEKRDRQRHIHVFLCKPQTKRDICRQTSCCKDIYNDKRRQQHMWICL